ncbi:hypothetical protein PACTADRAFT_3947 [Pachysolen tannophilus NRRL Y-2460]|uniref:dynamin GTPase n=1 Tax=Pachysolen tannophilus NRRL Y-2460 TaxID=669874 RepID=A0A1E4TTL7_PACTA|nr:hypothetical protein PACTADRAFT_3947 [Pachysolen tannophilus NRRL Y-2460]
MSFPRAPSSATTSTIITRLKAKGYHHFYRPYFFERFSLLNKNSLPRSYHNEANSLYNLNHPLIPKSNLNSSTLRSNIISSPLLLFSKPSNSLNNIVVRRNFSLFGIGKFAARVTKIPVAVGSGLAAAGSYVAYKVEQASSATQEQISKARDFANNVMDNVNDFFGSLEFGLDSSGNGGNPNGSPQPPNDGGDGAATAAAVGAAIGSGLSGDEENTNNEGEEEEQELLEEDDNEDDDFEDTTNDEMLNLTRQMIEIRNILAKVDTSNNIRLPSIVVIGSQSSGKSSVLEAIVGQEFLPKGSNMVTRRPIELTLVNSPELAAEVADFPALQMNNITDFTSVQKLLYDLNMQVPAHECISADPIQLIIKSPRVPDLSLVDLPGYIQVEAADQPMELKKKIKIVCDKYLESPNIILAISAADVDLANSAAIRAAKMADSRGERTIGVITKIDLVDPTRAREILTNKKYPLKMGYVGVVTKAPQQSIFRKPTGFQAFVSQQNFERQYFKENKEEFQGTSVGTRLLKKRLMKVLEKSMASSLRPTYMLVQQELEETSYKFKVEFNDRSLTPETYLAGSIDTVKVAVKEFSERFGRPELRSLLRSELDQRCLELLAERYWNKPSPANSTGSEHLIEPNLQELQHATLNDLYWVRKLDLATSSLTKSGVGRMSTLLITHALLSEIDNIVDNTTLRGHPMARNVVKESAQSVLNGKFFSTADQVENCIKPYKYEIELEDREWALSREHSIMLLKEELRQCTETYNELKKQVGGRKLSQLVSYLEEQNNSKQDQQQQQHENLNFSYALIKRGKEAMFLKDRTELLKFRIQALKSSQCKFKENKYKCPEIFLDAVAEKLTQTAVLFLNVELLSDFYYNFPRELDIKISNLTKEQIELFAKEDPKVKRHVEIQQRKELLELAMNKIEDVLALQKYKAPLASNNGGDESKNHKGWFR